MKDQLFNNEQSFRQWLNTYDPSDQAADELLQHFISGIHLLGIDIYRSSMWLPTSHPELWGTQLVWSREHGTDIFRRDHNITSTPTYLNTPGEAVHQARTLLRWKLDIPSEQLPYPLLQEVQEEGGTDYLIIPFHTDHAKEQPWITFATQRPGGFSELEINMLKELCVPLSWKARVLMAEMAIQSLLGVYLGNNAAQRVISGEFKRGTGERIHAIIWVCDLRGFTALSEQLNAAELVHVLDQYFECMAKPIEAAGGEILKFIGDAVLAIFPLSNQHEEACEAVLHAATQALDNLQQWNQNNTQISQVELKAGIALHIGEVLYGNVGGSSRLDFTVIGSAVNEVSRVEGLCKSTAPLLATQDFAQYIHQTPMQSIGKYSLRGVQKEHEIFTLKNMRETTHSITE